MLIRSLPLLFLVAFAYADVKFTAPAAGGTIKVAPQITVQWTDDTTGKTPLADLVGYQVFLMAGGAQESNSQQITTSTPSSHATGTKSIPIPINAASGPPGALAYYLKIVSTPKTGGQVINYSSRFTITGMTGQWSSPAFESAWEAVKGNPNSVPPTVNTAGGAANVPPGAQGDAAIPYAQQTGQIRFAPMQGHPPTKITKTATDRLYETSAWTVAKEHLPTPFAVKTNTAPITYKFSTRENTAEPNPMPSDDMAKFLARWKD